MKENNENNFNNQDTDTQRETKTYYYSATDENIKRTERRNGKKVAALSLLIIVCVLLSSITTSYFMSRFYEDKYSGNYIDTGNGSNSNVGSSNPQTPPSGANDTVIINKNEASDKEPIEGNIGDSDMTVAQVTYLVADSVVEITTSSVKYNFYYGQYVESGAGSGVIIGHSESDANIYYVVTNHHVIEDAEKIQISLRDGEKLDGTLVGTDMVSDIAVIQISSQKALTVATLGNDENAVVGEEVVVIGNPLGQLGGTVTNGIISALGREVNVGGMKMTLMQTNAAISPGNSGGGMFNMSGELIGVINAKYSADSAEGLGFAIPIDYAYEIISDLLKQGYVSGRAALPISYQEFTYNTTITGGTSSYLIVSSVDTDTGIKVNDMIYSIDDIEITTEVSLISALSNYKVGDTVEIKVARTEGRTSRLYTYKVTLIESVPKASAE